jgi:hypothetical protein
MKLDTLAPYAARIADSDYAQDNLRDALENLRAAYDRASRRKAAQAADDKKLYRHVRRAVSSLKEAATAIVKGREKPKSRWPKRIAVIAALGGAAAIARTQLAPAADEQAAPAPVPDTEPTTA